jgi:anthranilate synthase component 2
MILLIDNYDSFSYNLYQLIGTLDPDIRVVRNDAVTVQEAAAMAPEAIVLSPGPGRPEDAGICIDIVKELGGRIPILGVCLGHQAICTAYGAVVSHAKELMHGKQSAVHSIRTALFSQAVRRTCRPRATIRWPFRRKRFPPVLSPLRKRTTAKSWLCSMFPIRSTACSFTPESIMTPDGIVILRNFLKLAKAFS